MSRYREFSLPPSVRLSLDASADQVPVRDAATVLLVRDAAGRDRSDPSARTAGVEVFVFRRVRGMAFAAGMLAFPGGASDPQDTAPELAWAGAASGPVATAVRETFEECGVLIARPGPGAAQLPALREALLGGRATLADVLRQAGAVLDAGLLHPWARWVTPPGETRRFDTRFYLARVPAGQEPLDLGGEGEAAGWQRARDALARQAAGELPILPPTQVALEEVAAAASVDALFATVRGVPAVRPQVVEVDGPDGGTVRVLRIAIGDDGVPSGDDA